MYSKLEVLHLQCLIIANSSSLSWCGCNCLFSSIPDKSSQVLLCGVLHYRDVAESSLTTPSEALAPSLILFWVLGWHHFAAPCPMAQNPPARPAWPRFSAALQHQKNLVSFSSSWKISPGAPHHGQRHGVQNFLCNTINSLPGSGKSGRGPPLIQCLSLWLALREHLWMDGMDWSNEMKFWNKLHVHCPVSWNPGSNSVTWTKAFHLFVPQVPTL